MNRSMSSIRSGMLDALINGGTQAVFLKSTKNMDLGQRIALSYAANMVTATVRGIAFNKGWHEEGGLWHDDFDKKLANEPVITKDGDKNDYLRNKWYYESQKAPDAELKQIILANSRGTLIPAYKRVGVDSEGRGVFEPDGQRVYLGFKDERPVIASGIGYSLMRANMQLVANSLSFGLPSRPEKTSTMDFVNYLDGLPTNGNIVEALGQSIVNTNLRLATANIVDAITTSRSMADAFGLTPIRFSKVVNAVDQPYIIQRLQYNPALFNTNTQVEFMLDADGIFSLKPLAIPQNPDGGADIFKYKSGADLEKITAAKAKDNMMVIINNTPKANQLQESINADQNGQLEYEISSVKEMFISPTLNDPAQISPMGRFMVEVKPLGGDDSSKSTIEIPVNEATSEGIHNIIQSNLPKAVSQNMVDSK